MVSGKAQGLTTSTLILIALGILILITSIVFYTQITDGGRKTISECQNQGGQCQDSCGQGEFVNSLASCPDSQRCCVGANT